MKNMQKRGLSTVVATMLIVMITIAAAAVISQAIIPFVRNNLYSGTECVNFREAFTFQDKFEVGGDTIKYNCYNKANKEYYISIKAKDVGEDRDKIATGFIIHFLGNGSDSGAITINNNSKSSCGPGNMWLLGQPNCAAAYNIAPPVNGGIKTYVYNGSSSGAFYGSVEIRPVKANGRVCERSDYVTLEECE